MTKQVLTRYVASISDLKKNPMETVSSGYGEPIAILNRNTPAFYCIPAKLYEKMIDILEDQQLIQLAIESEDEPTIEISIDELRTKIQSKSFEPI